MTKMFISKIDGEGKRVHEIEDAPAEFEAQRAEASAEIKMQMAAQSARDEQLLQARRRLSEYDLSQVREFAAQANKASEFRDVIDALLQMVDDLITVSGVRG